MRISISTTSSRRRPAWVTTSSPSPASPTTVVSRLGFEDLAQPDAHQGLVVGDQDAGHRTGSSTRTAKPPTRGWRTVAPRTTG
jgi:hypothetical protein